MADSGSDEINLDVDTEPMPNEAIGNTSEQQAENTNSSIRSKVKDELMRILSRGDIPPFHVPKMRDLMRMLSSSTQFSGIDKLGELKGQRQCSLRVDNDMPFCDKMMHIMDFELYEAVCDRSAEADGFVCAVQQVCEKRNVDLDNIFFNHVTPTGDSLLHVAAQHGSEQVLYLIALHYPKLLRKTNLNGDTPLHVAARANNFVAIKNILDMEKQFKASFDVEEAESMHKRELIMLSNKYGRTALHEVVLSKSYDVVLFLLVAHNESDLTTHWTAKYSNSCKSPMHLAVLTRDEEILDLLLRIIPIPLGKPISDANSPLYAAISERNEGKHIPEMLPLF